MRTGDHGAGRHCVLMENLSQLKGICICIETLTKVALLAVLFEVIFRLIFQLKIFNY